MLFNSVFFITIFLPMAVLGFYLLQRLRSPLPGRVFLTLMSLWFYGYYNPKYLAVLIGSLIFNHLMSMIIRRGNHLKACKIMGITGNLALLFVFKYFGFFLENVNFLLHADLSIERLALPLGISFFTFQQISFIVDRCNGKAEYYSFPDYAAFVTFFPQLIAGPIVLHSEFLPQLTARENRRPDAEKVYRGLALFTLGLSKKVLLADTLAQLVNAEYAALAYLDAPSAWVTIIFYMLELYFDFSGYTDMARGIGMLFGFTLPENFNSPLTSISVKDFWRRWHITLSRFFGTYVYIPLGGNRKGKAIQCRNLFIVFLLSGIWHGAGWTFIVWGIMHGICVIFETLVPPMKAEDPRSPRCRILTLLRKVRTFLLVTLSFSIFRADSLQDTAILWKRLFAGGWNGMLLGISGSISLPEFYVIQKLIAMKTPGLAVPFCMAVMVGLLLLSLLLITGPKAESWIQKHGTKIGSALLLAVLFLWSFASLSQVSTFLYFDF